MLALAILVAFVAAAAAPPAFRRWPRATTAAAVGAVAIACAWFAWQVPAIGRGEVVTTSYAWIPALGVRAAFRLDGLSLLFALAITGVGALVLLYSPPYRSWKRDAGRLLGLLLAFLGSMLGLVLADDAITMFVFWELTSFTSFFLIAFDDTPEHRSKARQALLVTSAGGLVLLVGLVLLARAAAPADGIGATLSALAAADLHGHPHYAAITILIAIGAFTKSAQFPFHFWLPSAMVAPSPVSAFLHSATMVKAGIYLLARLHPVLGGTALWTGLLAAAGTTTFVLGALLAIVQRDLKLSLAYATISVLGALTLLIGLGSDVALETAVVLFAAHVAYKASLFLVAGSFDHEQHTRDPFAKPGVVRQMPVTATAAVIAAASMAGLPPLLGFVAKDAVIATGLDSAWPALLTTAAVVAGSALVATAALVAYAPFLRGPRARGPVHDAPPGMLVGPLVLAALGIAFGVAPGSVLEPIAGPAVAAIAGHPTHVKLELWPGLHGVHGIAFGLGIASLVVGALGYVVVARRREAIARLREGIARIAGTRAYDGALGGIERGAAGLTKLVQHGQLHGYVAVTIATVLVLAAAPVILNTTGTAATAVTLTIYELPLVIVAAGGVLAAVLFRDRFAVIAALGATGLSVAFLFALFSGPDLAITQFAVETMMVILLVLVVRRLPRRQHGERTRHRITHAVIAAGAGALVSVLLVLATATERFAPEASDGHARLAAAEESENVVNAILVNFRALDTLGEITVLAIAGIGVLAVLRMRRR